MIEAGPKRKERNSLVGFPCDTKSIMETLSLYIICIIYLVDNSTELVVSFLGIFFPIHKTRKTVKEILSSF